MAHETIEVSKCCKADLVEDFKDNPRDHHDPIEIYSCKQCKRECETEEVCADCLDTGEVAEMDYVYPGEPHMAPIGTRKCICQLREKDEDDNDDIKN